MKTQFEKNLFESIQSRYRGKGDNSTYLHTVKSALHLLKVLENEIENHQEQATKSEEWDEMDAVMTDVAEKLNSVVEFIEKSTK